MAEFQTQKNPYEDRITGILQKRAQPYNAEQIGLAGQSAQLRALAGQNTSIDQVLQSVLGSQTDRELQSTQGLYDMFEKQRAAGDAQANALYKRMEMFTGGDPEGNALFLEELHKDPDTIDPSNAFQVMTKLAGIAKKTGYKPLDSKMKEAQIASSYALANQREKGSGSNTVFGQVMAAIDSDPNLKNLSTIEKIRLAQNKVGTNLTIGPNGEVMDMSGAAEGLGNLKSGENFGKVIGEETGKQLVAKRQSAQDAQNSLYSNQQARQLLDSGVVTGTGADFVKALGKGLQEVGINLGADEISNTEAFVAQRAGAVGNKIKLFGSGTGLSDADREYAQQMAAGQISLTEDSIRKILEIDDKASKRIIQNFNTELSKAPQGAMPYDLSVSGELQSEEDPIDAELRRRGAL
jgi:hypothetical protein